ncbi:AbiH family protein [Brevibacterium sp. CFH 10365]|uniref:AbiH family protein n=1 Tax=Brevibacterium sp. CFH 10365 TaxID=2585207 RepID=UPI0012664489|nr:AbiH family protein [Brevibacterium sp. CFH 10365]
MSYLLDAEEYHQNQIWELLPSPLPRNINHLAIIGNGLDLAVGLESRYMDFRDFFLNLAEQSEQQGDQSLKTIYKQIKQITEDDWSDFETALAKVNLPSHVADFEYADAGDLSEMDYLTTEGTEYGDEFTSRLARTFSDWVKSEVSQQSPKNIPDSIKELIAGADAFITFNYTTTLQDHLGVVNSQILHVHGTADSSSEPYFGCPAGTSSVNQHGNNSINEAARNQTHEQMVQQLVKHPRLDLIEAFLSKSGTLKNVSSFGFSFGDADHEYVESLILHTDANTKWINYCYNNLDQSPDRTEGAFVSKNTLKNLGYTGSIGFRSA